MFNDNQKISNHGNDNNIAGNDIYQVTNNYHIQQEKKNIEIEKIIIGFSKVIYSDVEYLELDLQEYSIESKIEFNKLTIFSDDYDDCLNFYRIIDAQVLAYATADPNYFNKIAYYVKAKYNLCHSVNEDPNSIVRDILKYIHDDLLKYGSIDNIDDLSYLIYFVFYIFAKCKIFRKPSENYAIERK